MWNIAQSFIWLITRGIEITILLKTASIYKQLYAWKIHQLTIRPVELIAHNLGQMSLSA